jgi:hypothetical protein
MPKTFRIVVLCVGVAVGLAVPVAAKALCAGPEEGGRWWNKDASGDPISIEVRLDDCGDQVLNGQQTKTRYSLRVFVKQSSGQLYQRPKVDASYRVSKGIRWLYARVPTGGYVDNMWLRTQVLNGRKQLQVFILHESLDSKPNAKSNFWFVQR